MRARCWRQIEREGAEHMNHLEPPRVSVGNRFQRWVTEPFWFRKKFKSVRKRENNSGLSFGFDDAESANA